VPLHIPPLRERREDIPVLVAHFLDRLAEAGRPRKTVAPEALEALRSFDWPGNVRQLENAIEHAVVLGSEQTVALGDLPESIRRERPAAVTPAVAGESGASLADIEIAALHSALAEAGNNLTRAARTLGITRRALTYRLDKYGIEIERRRGRPRKDR
jgi:DNA-binding NtrC family response regulator